MVLSLALVLALEVSEGRWALATDVQRYYRCLPFSWYLVTPVPDGYAPERGELVQFAPPDHVSRFTQAFQIIKIVAAVEGDRWTIEGDALFINDEKWGQLFLLKTLGRKPGAFDGTGLVAEGEVFVLGTNPSSYDSRYWGALTIDNINGRAHVIL